MVRPCSEEEERPVEEAPKRELPKELEEDPAVVFVPEKVPVEAPVGILDDVPEEENRERALSPVARVGRALELPAPEGLWGLVPNVVAGRGGA